MLCPMKQSDNLSKGYDEISIPYVEEVLRVSIYPLLESMGFDTDIYDGVAKMMSATICKRLSVSIS